ncbi:MAG TPA: ornithine cyclodeaminase family protein [Armatimonadota bacterium]|nr:ornithine cyclodeaminase family protein [Armatimonadota bacterium]
MKQATLRYLSRADVEACALSMQEILTLVEAAFAARGKDQVEMPPKPGIHPLPDAFIHAMPAYLPRMEAVGLKWVSGFPENLGKGFPYLSGLLILNDPETGLPLAVMECAWLTAERTGAATAVAARYLAHPDSHTLAILGCGYQGKAHVAALRLVLPELRRVQVYEPDPQRRETFRQAMETKHGLEAVAYDSPRKALAGAQVAVTAGPIHRNPTPFIAAEWLEEGGFACALDYDSAWKSETFNAVDKLCADDSCQFAHTRQNGFFRKAPDLYADLGEIVAGKKPGRENASERILMASLGVAIEDIAVATRIYQVALRRGIGRDLPL